MESFKLQWFLAKTCPMANYWSFGHRSFVTVSVCNRNCITVSVYLPSILRGMAGATPRTGPQCKDLCYDDIIQLTEKKEIILIDVREPSEIKETGKLPGSVHIPLGEVKQALELTLPDEFKRKYGIAKPDLTANLVFSCRSGKRSRTAMETAMSLGFLNSRHYDGGYLDWQKHHPGPVA